MTSDELTNYGNLPKIEKKILILVAEDIELNQVLVKNTLESWGCEVDIAENGLEAIKKVKEHDYDAVLMDIQMPVMDGITATREIRSLPEPNKSNLFIIAFTSIDLKDANKYKEAGMNDYIIKPYSEEELHTKIASILKKQKPFDSNTNKVPADNSGNNEGENTIITPNVRNEVTADDKPKLYDTAMIESIGRNNAAFTAKMIVMFVDIISQDFDMLKEKAANGNWAEVSQLAHRMKSTFGNMGVTSVLGFIKQLEVGPDHSSLIIQKLEDELAKVIAQMKSDYGGLF